MAMAILMAIAMAVMAILIMLACLWFIPGLALGKLIYIIINFVSLVFSMVGH